jgi:virulence-associated protein VagC
VELRSYDFKEAGKTIIINPRKRKWEQVADLVHKVEED